MNLSEVRLNMGRHYERKWQHHDGYWLDSYALSQRVYAASLYERRNAAIVRELPDGLNAVLDIGCGVGDLMLLLSQRSKTVFGVDIAEVNVSQAARNLVRSGVRDAAVRRAPAEALPFETGSFDVAVMADVIEHIPDRGTALAEVRRVLRPGGTFICVTPHRGCHNMISAIDRCLRVPLRASRAAWKAIGRMPRPASPPQPRENAVPKVFEQFLSSRELRIDLQGVGFTVESYRRICFYPGPEGGGVFASLMFHIWRALGNRYFDPFGRSLAYIFGLIERLHLFNQKQMWIAKS